MKLFKIILVPNAKVDKAFLTVTKEDLKMLEDNKSNGGYLRYSIDLYDEIHSNRTKKSKWFLCNKNQNDYEIKYFFEKLGITTTN